MSFENLHTGNIEEALLRYVDDALSPDEQSAVEAFVQLHPQYATELELLLQTRLPAEEMIMPGKEWLFSDSMMTLDFEDTLSEAELPRLSPDEPLPAFPWKESLYRTETPVRRMPPLYRVAAAAAVVLLLAGGWWSMKEESATGSRQSAVLSREPGAGSRQTADDSQTTAEEEPLTEVAVSDQPVNRSTDQPYRGPSTVDRRLSSNGAVYAKTDAQQPVKTVDQQQLTVSIQRPEAVIEKEIPAMNNPDVTNTTVATLNEQTTAQTPTYAVQTASEDPRPAGRRGGSLKGLLRKATRIIEARTGIETTNEDGELLIGVVAVKLD